MKKQGWMICMWMLGLVGLLMMGMEAVATPDLFVTSYTTNSVKRYDGMTGAFIGDFVTSGSGGISGPTRLTFGPDGNLYLSGDGSKNILKYDGTTGAFISVFVPSGSGGMGTPWGTTFGSDGHFYVVNAAAASVHPTDGVFKFDGTTGAFLGQFASVFPPSPGPTGKPFDLAFMPVGGDLLVTVDNFDDRIARFNGTTGASLGNFVPHKSGGLDNPTGSTYGPDGNLYVTSNSLNNAPPGAILKYNGTTGAFIGVFVPIGSGGMQSPWSSTFGPDGNLYVADPSTNQVLRYNGTTGAFINAFVPPGGGGLGLGFGLAFHDVTPVDNTPPSISNLTATPSVLWPPNHKMVSVTVSATVTDNQDPNPTLTITTVTSSEADDGQGDGNTSGDIVITGDLTVDLRAERSGKGLGRSYTINVQAEDASGNVANASVIVTVPKSQGK